MHFDGLKKGRLTPEKMTAVSKCLVNAMYFYCRVLTTAQEVFLANVSIDQKRAKEIVSNLDRLQQATLQAAMGQANAERELLEILENH